MKRTRLAFLLIVILLIPFVYFYWRIVLGSPNPWLYKKVAQQAKSELAPLNFPNQLSEEKYEEKYCTYDWKVKSDRCFVRYTKYFGTNGDPIETFILIDKNLKSRGWIPWYELKLDRERMALENGALPSHIYSKREEYNLETRVSFYDEETASVDNSLYKLLISDKERALMNQYKDKYQYIYKIEVFADVIR